MEKKIIITLAVLLSIVCSCNSVSIQDRNKAVPDITKYDTVYFGSEESLMNYSEIFLVNGATKLNNGVAVKTRGKGVNVWLDSLLYFSKQENRLIVVASTLDYGFSLLYYNGDSLSIEKIAINKPIVEDCKTSKFSVISITDSSFNSGYLIKSMLFYKLNNDGTLSEKKEYFPQKKEGQAYDFSIIKKCTNDSVTLYKGKVVDYIYK
jgi:hypothetical protein